MAGVLHPWWLLALVAVPLIWWLHRRDAPLARYPVAALFLWEAAAEPAGSGSARRSPDPAWRRRALIAALLALALAAPYVETQPVAVTAWIDASLSMQAVETGASRIEHARAELRRALDEDGYAEVVTRTLPRPLPETLARDTAHWLVTDGADAQVNAWAEHVPLERVIRVGTATENVAVTRLAARRLSSAPDRFGVLVAATNLGDRPAERLLVIDGDGTSLLRERLAIAAGATVHRRVVAGPATITAALDAGDVLQADDRLSIPAREFAPTAVSVDAGCGPSLRRAVEQHPALTVAPGSDALAIECPSDSLPAPAPAETARIRALRTATRPLPARPAWLPVPGVQFATVRLTAGVPAGRWPAQPDGRGLVALTAAGGPLVVATPTGAGRHGVDTVIDLADPAFAREPAYAPFVAALVDIALGRPTLDPVVSRTNDLRESTIRPLPVTAGTATAEPPFASRRLPLTDALLLAALLVLALDGLRLTRARTGIRHA